MCTYYIDADFYEIIFFCRHQQYYNNNNNNNNYTLTFAHLVDGSIQDFIGESSSDIENTESINKYKTINTITR